VVSTSGVILRCVAASANLDLIVTVVVEYKYAVELTVGRHDEIGHILHAFRQRLSRVLLHLYVEKLPTTQHARKCNLINCMFKAVSM